MNIILCRSSRSLEEVCSAEFAFDEVRCVMFEFIHFLFIYFFIIFIIFFALTLREDTTEDEDKGRKKMRIIRVGGCDTRQGRGG